MVRMDYNNVIDEVSVEPLIGSIIYKETKMPELKRILCLEAFPGEDLPDMILVDNLAYKTNSEMMITDIEFHLLSEMKWYQKTKDGSNSYLRLNE